MKLTCQAAAFLLLGLKNHAGKLLHLLPAQFELRDHLIKGVDKAVKAVVGYLAQLDVHVLHPTAYLVHAFLQTIQGSERTFEDPVVDDKTDHQPT